MQRVRTAARALIVHEGALLTIKMRSESGNFYILPGGGQLHGETLAETVVRECREEAGCAISVQEVAYIREYIGKNHSFLQEHRYFHQLEVVFHATLRDAPSTSNGRAPDKHQVDVQWIPLDELENVRFLPKSLITQITGALTEKKLYWGDVN